MIACSAIEFLKTADFFFKDAGLKQERIELRIVRRLETA